MSKIAKASLLLTGINICGVTLVFLSNIVIARYFGAGKEMDIYFSAITLPLYIVTIFSFTLSFTFIPIFSQAEKRAERHLWETTSSFLNLSSILAVLICVAGIYFSKELMSVIVPGFSQDEVRRAAVLMSLMFPIIIFSVINELMASIYYSHNRFLAPSLNKLLGPSFTILFVLMFGSRLNTSSLVIATITAYFVQMVILLLGFLKNKDFRYSFYINIRDPEMKKIFGLMAPLVITMLITKAMPLTDRYFLSQFPEGSITFVSYAYRITLRLLEIVVSGITVALFPAMAASAGLPDRRNLYYYMTRGIKVTFFFIVPFAVLFMFFGKPAIRIIFEGGKFSSHDVDAMFKPFSLYLISAPAIAVAGILYKTFYALQKNLFIASVNVAMTLLYIGLCAALLKYFGYLAIPLAHAISFNLNMVIAAVLINKYLRTSGYYSFVPEIGKNLLCAFGIALIFWPLMKAVAGDPAAYFLSCLLYLIAYFFLAKNIFRLEASEVIWKHVAVYDKVLCDAICASRKTP